MALNKLNEVTYLRVFAITSLVLWHSYCSYTSWGIGNSPLDHFYRVAFLFITPIANMPLFTFLSGYLFFYLLNNKHKYTTFNDFLRNKTNRLLIPYLLLGFVINLTQIGRGKPLIPMLYGAPNHMWYCLMLFNCFMICWIVEKKCGARYNYILAFLSAFFVFIVGKRYLSEHSLWGVWMVAYFYCFFYLGYITYKYAEYIFPVAIRNTIILIVAFVCSALLSIRFNHIAGLSSAIFVILLVSVTRRIKRNPPRWMEIVAKYSFGIYVFHQWIIWNVTRYSPMQSIIQEHYILFPVTLYVCVFTISLLFTHLSLKTRIGRYLLL